LEKVQQETLHDVIHKNVEPGAQLYTDAHSGYLGLTPEFLHAFIDHTEKYVDGLVHTNGMENFWCLFKRCIKGTHVSVEPFHLAAYVDSEAFRFNNREVKDGDRFRMALAGAPGKRLTYKALIGALEGLSNPENGNTVENDSPLPN
jgi:transposase-like protein